MPFNIIRTPGQESIVSDQSDDILDIYAGPGIEITANASIDTITISATGSLIGDQGYSGSTGFTGSNGQIGFTGSLGITGFTGSRGDTGMGFTIAKSYTSVSDLQEDLTPTGIVAGQFAIIETGSVNDPENSRLYLWNGTAYTYITDLSGAVGFTGFTGSVGITGFTGSLGISGFTGSLGGTGFTGSQGFAGSQGFTGSQGDTGFTGSQGDTGFTGSQGITGFDGSLGFTGPTGFTGSQGIIGYAGSVGDTGTTGFTGSFGTTGFTGSFGTTGFTGSQGQIGFTGSQGDDGYVGSQGAVGFTGSIGLTGFQGNAGYTGSQGETGFTGSRGFVGYTGSEGATGGLGYTGSAAPNYALDTGEPLGFVNRTDSVISFDNLTRTFAISPAVTAYEIYSKGTKYTISATQSVTIPNTTGLYYIYFDLTGTLQYKTTIFDWPNDCMAAYVYWNSDTQAATFVADERHGVTLDWQTHEYLHRTRGAAYASGFQASNYLLNEDGSSDTHVQLDIANGVFFDEDLQVDVIHSNSPTANTWEQDLQGPARIPILYRSGTAWVLGTATDYPLKQGTSLPQYNLNTAGNWSTVDIDNNKFGITFVIATNNINYPVMGIIGQEAHANESSALAVDFTDLDTTGFPVVEFRPLYKLVYDCKNSYTNTVRSRLVALQDLRGASVLTITASGTGGSTGFTGSFGTTGFTGSKGDTGFTGSFGTTGFTGSKGDTGFTGSFGVTGFTGSRGVTGFDGSFGVTGFTGSFGTTGFNGSFGVTGFTGSFGTTGFTGSFGTTGFTGSFGVTGFTGSRGATGFDGSFGTTGFTGSFGVTGFTGSRGATGFTGSFGDTGYTGSKGEVGMGFTIAKTYVSVAALTADTSPTGIVAGQFALIDTGNVNDPENSRIYLWDGSVYSYVSDLSGSIGFTGFTGSQGNIGFTGSRGATGFDGSRGATGFTGSVGFTGSKGDTGFTGSFGVTGFTGSFGVTGFTGSFGTTGFTGSFGTTGFTGSRGVTGFDGSFGTTGFTGSRGATGFTGSFGTTGFTGSFGTTGFTGSQGSAGGLQYAFSTNNTVISPALGTFRFNNSVLSSATTLGLSGTDNLSTNQQAFLQELSTGVATITDGETFTISFNYDLLNSAAGTAGTNVTFTISSVVGTLPAASVVCGITFAKTGFVGSVGNTGFTGSFGTTGFTGSRGATGFDGSFGATGFTGSRGLTGFTGSFGTTGFTGSFGVTGFTGSFGTRGFTGSAGPSNQINATNNTTNTALYPVMVGAAGTNQVANVTTSKFVFNAAAGNLTVTGNIISTGDVIAYFSDDRLKTRLGVIENPIEKINALTGFYYIPSDLAREFGYTSDEVRVGVSAQEVQAVLPEVVTSAPISDEFMTVKYERLVPLLIEAVKAQQLQINQLLIEVENIKNKT